MRCDSAIKKSDVILDIPPKNAINDINNNLQIDTIKHSPRTEFYTEKSKYTKLVFLQVKIKTFLRKKKNKEKYNNMGKKGENNEGKVGLKNQLGQNTSGITTANLSSSNNTKQQQQEIAHKGKNKRLNKFNNEKNNNAPSPDDINIPQVAMALKGNKIMTKDPFMKTSNRGKGNNNGDPRNGPFDGVRRSFKTIKEDDFSYTGEWMNGRRDGVGKLVWEKVAKFLGEFREDIVKGYGTLFHEDGDVYRGYWLNFMADGVGIYKNRKNIKYEGYWSKDKQEGFGRETWGKNNLYEGEYVDGFKNGIGLFRMEGRGTYQGEIQKGNIHGIGSFEFSKDKRKYTGEWKNNKMDGYGIITWPDKKVFVGEFHEDKPEGFGVYFTNKKIYIGIWFSGVLEGETIIVEGGKIKKQYWEEGRIIQNYSADYEIFFEKYVPGILKDKTFFLG